MFSLLTKIFEPSKKETAPAIEKKESVLDQLPIVEERIQSAKVNEHELIKEIHNAFDCAEDELLSISEKILKELNIETESGLLKKANLYQEIGFTANPIVEKANKIIKTESTVTKAAELIRYYKREYPFQKFLSEEQLDNICKKYNLIYAPIAHYKEDVPERNLLEIKNAKKLLAHDSSPYKHIIKVSVDNISKTCPSDTAKRLILGVAIEEDFKSSYSPYATISLLDVLSGYIDIKITDIINPYRGSSCTRINTSGLFIAAPKNHFNLEGLSKEGTLGFFDVEIIEIKDPIVFRYVKGGVQVISKWGLEASDPALINPIEN